MRIGKLWQYGGALLLLVGVWCGGVGTVAALTSSSPNYQITEAEIGTGSASESCSGQYCAQVSIGSVSDGQPGVSTATFEELLDNEPVLEVIIDPGQSNLGVLSTETTATKTMTVRVRTHLSGGYTLQIAGKPPVFDGHTLATPTTPTASTPGAEQFGLNLVANTTPTVGSDPIQVPAEGGILFGTVADAYRSANLFAYISEDVVARSVTDSGRTDYTVSMIVNISNATPPGHYTGDFAAIIVPAY